MVNSLRFLEQIDLDGPAKLSPQGDHKPGQIGSASDSATEARNGVAGHDIDFERDFLLSLGWPVNLVCEFELEARNAKVSLIQAAIAAGVLNASDFYDRLSRMLSFAGGNAPYRVRLPSAPSEAWLLIEHPVPLAADEPGMVALNGQTFSLNTLMALSAKLGDKRRRLRLLTRQELIDGVTKSYGRVLVERAVAGLIDARPDWSAKTGLALWQVIFGAVIGGLFLGTFAIAPHETLTLAGLGLSLFFLLATCLRLAAVLNLAFPIRKMAGLALLSDADLPHYTVFVPLFKEVDILPYLAAALADLDYPSILAHLPERSRNDPSG
jgi:glycosyltransferase XagB